jgi:host factor-I protein
VAGKISRAKAPEHTSQEFQYLTRLSRDRVVVRIRLIDGQECEGVVEFFDITFLRLTREGEPNLFVFKHEIKYMWEVA